MNDIKSTENRQEKKPLYVEHNGALQAGGMTASVRSRIFGRPRRRGRLRWSRRCSAQSARAPRGRSRRAPPPGAGPGPGTRGRGLALRAGGGAGSGTPGRLGAPLLGESNRSPGHEGVRPPTGPALPAEARPIRAVLTGEWAEPAQLL